MTWKMIILWRDDLFQGSGFDPLFPFEMDKFWGTQLEIDHIKLREKI